MKAPLVCSSCDERLDSIWNPDDTYDSYQWDSKQRAYVLELGTSHMECPHCGSHLQSDYVFDTPESFKLELVDTTDESAHEEVNVNGTVYSNAEIDDEACIEFIKEQNHELFEEYPDILEVTLLEKGQSHRHFQDYCIETKDGSDMKHIIDWWKTQDLPNWS
jgi:hypothetical protein